MEWRAAICGHLVFFLVAQRPRRQFAPEIPRSASGGSLPCETYGTPCRIPRMRWNPASRFPLPVRGSRRNSETSLDPAGHGKSSSLRPLQVNTIGLASRIKFGRALHGGDQMSDAPARQADLNLSGQLPFQVLHNMERRYCPDRSVFPPRLGAEETYSRHGVGSRGQLTEAEPRERGGAIRSAARM